MFDLTDDSGPSSQSQQLRAQIVGTLIIGDTKFNERIGNRSERAPLGELVDIMDVGFACAYLATPYARRITGGTIYVDGGANIRA